MIMHKWKLIKTLFKNIRCYEMNRELIGFSVERSLDPIEPESTNSFAEATKDENQSYYIKAGIVPPLYFYKLTFPLIKEIMAHHDLHVNIFKVVYAEQKITWHHPIKIKDQLYIRAEIKNIYETPVGEMIEIAQTAYNKNQLATEGTMGIIVRNKNKLPIQKKSEEKKQTQLFSYEVKTDKGQQLKFAQASGDFNIIHTSNLLARLAGLPGAVMHGACTLAMSCNCLVKNLLDNNEKRMISLEGRFGKPTLPGETLTIIGYDSPTKNSIPFEIISSSGNIVFKNGIFSFK